ncbi:MAG: PucR family transcriptional regulator ligand-binding domain-containing protein [Lachnospiraceae bacterium]|nr:PucR family transcriptional regulator ligand-binding domain-containing protein [Lachnospiraceae bacterium]
MALTLETLYQEIGQKFRLRLLAGEEGLKNIVNWFYLAEDLSNVSFIRPGYLVVTTGFGSSGDEWLLQLLQLLADRGVSGLIVNTGQYLQEKDLNDGILTFCQEHQLPLFQMPWEIHIADLSSACGNWIFTENHRTDIVAESIRHLLTEKENQEKYVSRLSEKGFDVNAPYRIAILDLGELEGTMQFHAENYMSHHEGPCCFFSYKNRLVLIFVNTEEDACRNYLQRMLGSLQSRNPRKKLQGGIGQSCMGLCSIYGSLRGAEAALTMARVRNNDLEDFAQLGFYQLLLMVEDTAALEQYCSQKLEPVLAFDQAHHGDYAETLKYYLLYRGSISQMAESLNCHRNTVNYRVRALKDLYGDLLLQPEFCFELQTAFAVQEYLKIFR